MLRHFFDRRSCPGWLAATILVVSTVTAFADTELKAKGEYIIEPGESLYAVVANNYPERMNRWTDVASDIVALNPTVLTRGMDTPLRPGMVLKLVDYDSDRAAAPGAASESMDRSKANSTSDTVGASSRPAEESALETRPQSAHARDDAQGELIDNVPAIGHVAAIKGKVQSANLLDQVRFLQEGDPIYIGEIIHSGRNASIQLIMVDQATYAFESDSRFAFEIYDFAGGEELNRSVVTLSGGGFRIASGLIAKRNPSAVSVNTPVATISVRDSDFALQICEQESCRFSIPGQELQDGLYTGVLKGTATLTNNAGEQVINAGEFYYTPSPDTASVEAPGAAPLLYNAEELLALDTGKKDEPKSFLGWLFSKLFGD